MDDLYMDNLDIYDTLNADTDQGKSFLDYKKRVESYHHEKWN